MICAQTVVDAADDIYIYLSFLYVYIYIYIYFLAILCLLLDLAMLIEFLGLILPQQS